MRTVPTERQTDILMHTFVSSPKGLWHLNENINDTLKQICRRNLFLSTTKITPEV